MAAVDRNALRLGVFEILFCDDIPATVSINEMIELAKQFGSESSPSFINGILDKIRQMNPNPNKAK
jgi:N utilization substance protein B